jgi:RimJ/RimL family protein N-acetyltransferase
VGAAPHPGLEDLRTPRLHLRRITQPDLPDIERMHQDPEVMATLGGLRSAEQTRDFIDQAIAHWTAYGFGLWVVRDIATGALVGRGGVKHVVVGGRPELEVVYGLMPEFWDRGLATELARESVRVGFERLGRADLVCFTLVTNRASQRVMEKVGFVFECDVQHAGLPHLLYRLRASAWRSVAER